MHGPSLRVRVLADVADLGGIVERAEFRRLRDGDDARLGVMFFRRCVCERLQQLDRELSVFAFDRQNFAAGETFQGSAFVRLQMRGRRADDRLVRLRQATERDDVGARAVKREIHVCGITENLAKARTRSLRIRIASVADGIAVIRAYDRIEDLGRYRRVVVAGERAHDRAFSHYSAAIAAAAAARREGRMKITSGAETKKTRAESRKR